jgi:hypothetical protein
MMEDKTCAVCGNEFNPSNSSFVEYSSYNENPICGECHTNGWTFCLREGCGKPFNKNSVD